jgi:hypothetical protein
MISAGLDTAFRKNSSALAVVQSWPKGTYSVTYLREWIPSEAPLKPSIVLSQAVNACRNRGVEVLCTDHRDISHVEEHLEDTDISLLPFVVKPEEIAEAFAKLRYLLSEERVEFLDFPETERLVSQLLAVTGRPGDGGTFTIRQPQIGGSHGDIVSALVHGFHAQEVEGFEASALTLKTRRFSRDEEDPERMHDTAAGMLADDPDHD